MRWWSKERRPTSCGEMQVQGLPGAPPESPAPDPSGAGLFACAHPCRCARLSAASAGALMGAPSTATRNGPRGATKRQLRAELPAGRRSGHRLRRPARLSRVGERTAVSKGTPCAPCPPAASSSAPPGPRRPRLRPGSRLSRHRRRGPRSLGNRCRAVGARARNRHRLPAGPRRSGGHDALRPRPDAAPGHTAHLIGANGTAVDASRAAAYAKDVREGSAALQKRLTELRTGTERSARAADPVGDLVSAVQAAVSKLLGAVSALPSLPAVP